MIIPDLLQEAKKNTNFRQVLHTGSNSQLVVMSLAANEDIGEEKHETIDQLFIVVEGTANVVINGQTNSVKTGDFVYVHKGEKHNFVNPGPDNLKLITVYSPPAHKDGTIHATKNDALKGHEKY